MVAQNTGSLLCYFVAMNNLDTFAFGGHNMNTYSPVMGAVNKLLLCDNYLELVRLIGAADWT